jgi:hypothetical protein
MPSTGRDRGPLIAALVAYLAAMIGLVTAARTLEGGSFTYPLDDTYIHLAIARHLAHDHTWGISAVGFASCSSSPLWTLLLGAWIGTFGHGTVAPLALATLFGLMTIGIAWAVLRRHLTHPLALVLALLLAVAATPLPAVSLTGLEHVLHTGLSVAFAAAVAETLTRDRGARPPARALLLVLAALLAATRYEGLFLVFCACVAFALRRRVDFAVTLGLVALAPVVGYGLWAMKHGWLFFPSSILLKANLPSSRAGMFSHSTLLTALRNAPHLAVLVLAAAAALAMSLRAGLRWSRGQVFAGLFLGAALLHLQFARVGWLYRYEAYLVFLGVIATAIAASECRERWWARESSTAWKAAVTAVLLVAVLPLAQRAWASPIRAARATKNIHDQQVQMARFLARFYDGAPVAATDVGAISYLTNVRLLDLNGLGSIDVARLRLAGSYDSPAIQRLATDHGIEVAVGYDEWYAKMGGVPPQWTRVGEWRIARNVVCEDDRVTWFAVDPSAAARLTANLASFSGDLPRDVAQTGAYLAR